MEQVREVGVSLDGMVGKGIRVLSSWVGFSCLVVRAWLLLVLFLLVGLSCPLRCLSFSFFSWCAWWHCFLRWSSCLVLLGSFSGSFLVLRCPCALVCGLLPLFFLAVPLVCLLSACFGWLDPIDAGTVLLPSCLFGFLPCGGAWSVSAFSRRSLVSFLGSVVLGSFSGVLVGPCALVLLLLPCFRSRGMLLSLGSGAAFGAASPCLDLLPFVPCSFWLVLLRWFGTDFLYFPVVYGLAWFVVLAVVGWDWCGWMVRRCAWLLVA